MKKILIYLTICASVLFSLSACFKAAPGEGYLGTGIHLQGSDTLTIPIGQQVSTMSAWLDNSTRPVKFEIYDIRDKFGDSKKEFFKESEITVWSAPYDRLTDITKDLILQKIGRATVTPIMINPVNGQLYSMPTTAQCELDPGDIFNVDVKVSNSKGAEIIKDYAVLKFLAGTAEDKIQIVDFVNGICVEYKDEDGVVKTTFPYYDQVNSNQSDFSARVSNILKDNGKEKQMALRKVSDEPSTGIKVQIKLLDQDGKMFDPATYGNYTTTLSLMDVGIDRTNDATDGMTLEFPTTPWPVIQEYHYMRGTYYKDLRGLDVDALTQYYKAHTDKASAAWSTSIFDPENFVGWYVRLRTNFRIYDSGTYEIVSQLPFTTAQ